MKFPLPKEVVSALYVPEPGELLVKVYVQTLEVDEPPLRLVEVM